LACFAFGSGWGPPIWPRGHGFPHGRHLAGLGDIANPGSSLGPPWLAGAAIGGGERERGGEERERDGGGGRPVVRPLLRQLPVPRVLLAAQREVQTCPVQEPLHALRRRGALAGRAASHAGVLPELRRQLGVLLATKRELLHVEAQGLLPAVRRRASLLAGSCPRAGYGARAGSGACGGAWRGASLLAGS